MPGAILVLGFVLYPYVYMTARAMFMTQPAHLMEAARTLGESRGGAFFRVALPLARPALAVGLSLALLETLNDIGASEFLGIQTLTVAVYTTWITRSDLAGAAQIACAMLVVVVALVLLERHGRRHQRFGSAQRMRAIAAAPPARRGGLARDCSRPRCRSLIGFVAPALYLVWETAKRLRLGGGISDGLLASLGNTLALAAGVTRGRRGRRPGGGLGGAQPGLDRQPRALAGARRHARATRCRARCWPSACSTPALAFDAALAGAAAARTACP